MQSLLVQGNLFIFRIQLLKYRIEMFFVSTVTYFMNSGRKFANSNCENVNWVYQILSFFAEIYVNLIVHTVADWFVLTEFCSIYQK
jgi:hypothetical protein